MFARHPVQYRIAPAQFGRRRPFTFAAIDREAGRQALADEARLFLTTFVGGLLFMTIYLA